MAKRRRVTPVSDETRSVQIPPAHNMNLSQAQILSLLRGGELEVLGLLPWSSNYTFLAQVSDGTLTLLGVYKPSRGERPLWDFPHGTLCNREVGAFLVSDTLGWNLVPPTILREGQHGLGSLQLFIDADQEEHYFTLKADHPEEFKCLALFDALLNNTDRKGGHCLIDHHGKIWAIDHGLTFHDEPKLRTVIWDFAGQQIPDVWLTDLRRFQFQLCNNEPINQELSQLLSRSEMNALMGRLTELIETGSYPEPGGDWYATPWPPV